MYQLEKKSCLEDTQELFNKCGQIGSILKWFENRNYFEPMLSI